MVFFELEMPDVPSVTKKYLEERKIFVPDVNLSVLRILYDYQNNFVILGQISDFIQEKEVPESYRKMYMTLLDRFRNARNQNGYVTPRLDLTSIFSEEEIASMRPDIVERANEVRQKADIINNLGIDDNDISLMCQKWREMYNIITAPVDGYGAVA